MNISLSRWISLLVLLVLILSACTQTTTHLKSQKQQFIDDVTFISQMPRISGELHHKKVQALCASRFKQLGFEVELHDYGTGINVIGIYPGKQSPSEIVMVSAHYDTVLNCNGADDNASGIAAVFETARILSAKQHDRTLVLACWDEEEKKVVGSRAYAEREKNNATDIKMSYVYEMIGYTNKQANSQQVPAGFERLYPEQVKDIASQQNRAYFIALIYDDKASDMLSTIAFHAEQQELPIFQFKVSSQLKKSPAIKDLRRSDHSAFWDVDYPAMMVTDTANFRNPHYHCAEGEDTIHTLDVDFAIKTINTLAATIEDNLMN